MNCNLGAKPEWLLEKSNGGKVPAIEFEDGQVLSESLIVSDFLNEAYPEPPLYPHDPRAKVRYLSRPTTYLRLDCLELRGAFSQ